MRRTWIVLACILLAGCAHGRRANPFSDAPEPDELEITVYNEGLSSRDVYAYWNLGARQWLGTVPSETNRRFTIRFRSDGIRFSGGPRGYFPVFRGDRLVILYPKTGQILPPQRVR